MDLRLVCHQNGDDEFVSKFLHQLHTALQHCTSMDFAGELCKVFLLQQMIFQHNRIVPFPFHHSSMVGVIAIYFCLPKFTHYLFELEN